MSRLERAAEAARLAAGGLNGIQVAERMGISRSYAYELLTDPDGTGVRERKARAGGTCEACGAPTSYTTGGGCRHCPTCAVAHRGETSAMRRRKVRLRAIERMWNDGYSRREIAAAIGSTENSVGSETSRMRKDGWDVPHRHHGQYASRPVAA